MEKNKIPTVAVKILPNKPDKDGLCEIKIRVTIDRKTAYYGIGKKIAPDKFDNRAGIAIGKSKAAQEINVYITKELNNANEAVAEMRKQNERASFELFQKYYYRQSINSFDYYVNLAMKTVEINRMFQYTLVAKELKGLFGENMTVNDLTPSNIRTYDDFMQDERKLAPNTRRQRHKIISRIINLAINGGEYFEGNPYRTGKFEMPKVVETFKETLTEEEYHKMKDFIPPTKKLAKIQDLFVFQCNVGLRYGDLNKLTVDNIKDGVLVVQMSKTKKYVRIPLTTTAQEIIERQPKRADKRIFENISNQKYNDYLKVLSNAVGIQKKVTTHVARYTLASIAFNAGITLDVVCEILGHSSIAITKIYAKTSPAMLKREMGKIDEKL